LPIVPQEVKTEFGAAVKRARSLKGWTLDQLSGAMDGSGSKSFLSGIEHGKRDISPPTVGKLINALGLDEGWIDRFLGSDTVPEAEVTQTDREADQLIDAAEQSGQSHRLQAEAITEHAIIQLAQRIAGETDDLGAAWTELQNAMDIAVRVQQEGRVPSNHGDFVDEVLKRATELAADGAYASASQAITDALAQEDAAHQARKLRLLTKGAEIAMLDGDAKTAALRLVQAMDLDAGGQAPFDALRALQDTYYVKGRDKGTLLDLIISIEIARITQTRASTTDERGIALNDLAVALQTLGQRESGTQRLEQAVAAYQAALEEQTRDRVPLDWAMTQMNLGNALQTLGQRESGTERLEQAVAAYQAALEEWTRDRVPLDWARTQMNLGSALQTLGERESGTERLEQAVAAYQAALEERTRDRVPLQWAMTQMNLGNALRALGERESGTERLEQAVAAYQAALEERTRDRVPLDWAMTQMNLGAALKTLGQRESGTQRLEQAVAAYQAALEEVTRDRVPLQWAMVQGNFCNLELAFFDKSGDPTHLDRAQEFLNAAHDEFTNAQASHYLSMVEQQQNSIDQRRAGSAT